MAKQRRLTGRRIRMVVVVVSAAAAVPAGVGVAAGWNTGVGGNAMRDGLSPFTGPDAAEVLWEGGLPAIVSQQAVIDGNIMVVSRIASFDIPTGTWIVAHELNTGKILWQKQLPYDFPGESWRSKTSAIRDGQVYATRAGNTNEDYLYALDEDSGEIIWKSEDLIDESTTESVSFAENGDVVVGNFTSIMRISKEDGTTVWLSPRSSPTSSGSEIAVYGDRCYGWQSGASGPRVTTWDVNTGDELYSSDGISPGWIQQIGLLVGPDGTVYAPRAMDNPATDFFVALDDTGSEFKEKWRVEMGYTPFASFGVGPDGTVYTYSRDLEVIRLDPETGAILNTSMSLGDNSPRMAIDEAGRVFVTNGGFGNGQLFAFNADLSKRWIKPLTGNNLGGPALGQAGVLVVCGTGSDVRAYQTAPACPADVNGDGMVDVLDLLAVLAAWGDCVGCPEDVNGDGIVDVLDLLAVLSAWGPCAPLGAR